MRELRIDRLTLSVSGISERDGTRLATLIARALGAADLRGIAPPSTLRLDLRAAPGDGLESLSEHIVAEMVRQLARSS